MNITKNERIFYLHTNSGKSNLSQYHPKYHERLGIRIDQRIL